MAVKETFSSPHDKCEERYRLLEAQINKLESQLNKQQCNGAQKRDVNISIDDKGVERGETSKGDDKGKLF